MSSTLTNDEADSISPCTITHSTGSANTSLENSAFESLGSQRARDAARVRARRVFSQSGHTGGLNNE